MEPVSTVESKTKVNGNGVRKWRQTEMEQIFILEKSKIPYVQEFQELPRLNPRLEERNERDPKVTRHFFWPKEFTAEFAENAEKRFIPSSLPVRFREESNRSV